MKDATLAVLFLGFVFSGLLMGWGSALCIANECLTMARALLWLCVGSVMGSSLSGFALLWRLVK